MDNIEPLLIGINKQTNKQKMLSGVNEFIFIGN